MSLTVEFYEVKAVGSERRRRRWWGTSEQLAFVLY